MEICMHMLKRVLKCPNLMMCVIVGFLPYRQDFEKNGLSSLITVSVRDIQGEGFPEEFCGAADSVFLDLPQPWLALPSVDKMLKQDGVLCSFSPCIEQVQRSCETLRSNFTGTISLCLLLYRLKRL